MYDSFDQHNVINDWTNSSVQVWEIDNMRITWIDFKVNDFSVYVYLFKASYENDAQ